MKVDHSTLNRWVLRYAALLEKRLRGFRKSHCGEVRIDETYIKVKGQWKYLYRAIDKDGTAVDFLLTAKRNIRAAQRFFRKAFKGDRLFAPTHISTDKVAPFPKTIQTMRKEAIVPNHCLHETKKFLQQGIENDHFMIRIKYNISNINIKLWFVYFTFYNNDDGSMLLNIPFSE